MGKGGAGNRNNIQIYFYPVSEFHHRVSILLPADINLMQTCIWIILDNHPCFLIIFTSHVAKHCFVMQDNKGKRLWQKTSKNSIQWKRPWKSY